MKLKPIKTIFILTLLALYACNVSAELRNPPNVVLLMADDLGYGDLSYTGSPDIKTPNIDQLTKEGVQFSNFYSSGPVCTPTRTALMTGRYQARFKDLEGALYMDVTKVGLPEGEETIARALQRNGYTTAMVGKWHIGEEEPLQPQHFGFDDFFGFLGGNIDYFRHCRKNQIPDLWHNGEPVTDGMYMTDLITQKSNEFIRKQSEDDQPFFLYVAYNAPHWPYQGPDDEPCKADGSDWMIGTRDHMVSMIERLDFSVGQIQKELKKQGLDDNTIIIFTSDNGGDKLARNFPFSGKKGMLRDGGIHVPLIMVWPGKIEAGSVDQTPAITMDISKTILDVTQSSFEANSDGISLVRKNSKNKNRCLVWRNEGKMERAVRSGKWKYLREKKDGKIVEYLFNLTEDPAEAKDLKKQNPKIYKKLKKEFEKWEKEMPYKQTLFGFDLKNFYADK